MVFCSPVLGSDSVTDGCPGFAGPSLGVTVIGTLCGVVDDGSVVVVVDCLVEAGPGCLSRIVLPTPDCRVARIDRDSEVTMNKIAEPVVALESAVADPRGPKAVWEPIPPNAPARSAAFPLCNKTTTMRNRHTTTCTIVNNV